MFPFFVSSQRLVRSFPFLGQRGSLINLCWIVPLVGAVIGGLYFLFRTLFPPFFLAISHMFGGLLLADPYFLLHGMLIGVSVTAPVGPVSIICMQNTISKGSMYGFASGLGNALAIVLYAALAAFGMTAITTFLVHQEGGIHLIGGLFLLYLGLKTVFSRPVEQGSRVVSRSIRGEVLSLFLLSLVNPVTILLFVAAFTSLGPGGGQSSPFSALLVVLGVFFGAILWRLFLVGGIGLLRRKLLRHTGWMVWINRLAGGILMFQGTTSFMSWITSISLLSHFFANLTR